MWYCILEFVVRFLCFQSLSFTCCDLDSLSLVSAIAIVIVSFSSVLFGYSLVIVKLSLFLSVSSSKFSISKHRQFQFSAILNVPCSGLVKISQLSLSSSSHRCCPCFHHQVLVVEDSLSRSRSQINGFCRMDLVDSHDLR